MSQSSVQTVDSMNSKKSKERVSKSLWDHAMDNIVRDKMAMTSLIIVGTYALIATLSALGFIASDWAVEVGPSYSAPGSDFLFGTDIFGRSVFAKMIKGTEVAMSVGLVAAVISVVIGVTLGSIAGYFGGKVDELIVWFYTCFQSIPTIMLLVAISFVMGRGLISMYVALGLTSWVNLCRLVRGEVMRHKNRDYVQAATALGGGHARKLIKHIFPNVSHLVIISFSLMFQTAIKTEVILSYLGLGVQGRPSWGTMIDDSKLELARGVWWQLGAATLAMMIVVLSLNILGDALRDALDPKLKGK